MHTQPTAWQACRVDLQHPNVAMKLFASWIKNLPGAPVFVAYPVGCDFLFVQWYFHMFIGYSPFGHSALDIRSYAMAAFKKSYQDSGKTLMPRCVRRMACYTGVGWDCNNHCRWKPCHCKKTLNDFTLTAQITINAAKGGITHSRDD